jgi:hypothetical protein
MRLSNYLLAGRSGHRILVGGVTFRTHPHRAPGPLSLLYNGYRVSFPGGKAAGYLALTTHPH